MSITFTSARTGRWSAPSTWKGGIVPPIGSDIVVENKHTVTLDLNVNINTLLVKTGATISFDRLKNCLLSCNTKVVVNGRFICKPVSTVRHYTGFTNIDESTYIGGEDRTDSGFWVDGGILELVGTPKTAWINLKTAAISGDTKIVLKTTPIAWKVGDEISITSTLPFTHPDFVNGFDVRTIAAISKNIITLNQPLEFDHPQTDIYTAEVLNLTRNVGIEGIGDGGSAPETNKRTHIFITNIVIKPIITNVQLRYVGPRRRTDSTTTKIQGRYGLHFHMCGDTTQGTIVDGVVIRDCGTHCFVPHASHGINFKNCISYNSFNCSYWWDLPPNNGTSPENNTNDTIFDNCVSAILRADPAPRGYRLANFMMGSGLRNEAKNCVATGNQGNAGAAGYVWGESSNYTDNLWKFDINNIAHNNKTDGIFTWQNDPNNHVITNFVAYNSGLNGIEHGAYTNAYKYSNIKLINNKYGIFLHANARPKVEPDIDRYVMSFKNINSDAPLYITRHTLVAGSPTLFKDCFFPKVIVAEIPKRIPFAPGLFDFVNCNLPPENFDIVGIEEGSLIRVQNLSGETYQINDKGEISPISPFFV